MENRAMPRAGEFYMHFKGKLYQIVTVAIHTETEETADIEPLLKFLDETDLHERLNILLQYRDQITETMLESMGMAMDCVLNGKTLEEKYYELDKVIRTKLQYEKKPRI